MRLPLLMSVGVLLVALLPCTRCRALLIRGPGPGSRQLPQPTDFFQPQLQPQQPQQLQSRPVQLRMGEEYFLRQGNPNKSTAAPFWSASAPVAGGSGRRPSPDEIADNFLRVLLQQQSQRRRPLDRLSGSTGRGTESALRGRSEAPERERRSEEAPISLDLTFHLLREVLELARAEQLAQQAHSNRKLMEIVGK
ncbi:corticoliberin [Sturnira hondurensis]|uniref:corticoliberin n=1 Tax=Sturnira hondurensis TaxID=192404 RepID=UPI00187A6FD1|nr:corticoliberin [Sturnira hondurensis]